MHQLLATVVIVSALVTGTAVSASASAYYCKPGQVHYHGYCIARHHPPAGHRP
jgi:hypothetical protein